MSLLGDRSNLDVGDAFYAALVNELDALGPELALRFLARLVLLLANQATGDADLQAAIAVARDDFVSR